jgi:hypothetical protein
MRQPVRFDPDLLEDHFERHKADFGVVTEWQYEEQAANFITKPLAGERQHCGYCPSCSCLVYGTVHECAYNGETIRYDTVTEELCILGANGFIRTYFKPKPEWTRRPNIQYYHECCGYEKPSMPGVRIRRA